MNEPSVYPKLRPLPHKRLRARLEIEYLAEALHSRRGPGGWDDLAVFDAYSSMIVKRMPQAGYSVRPDFKPTAIVQTWELGSNFDKKKWWREVKEWLDRPKPVQRKFTIWAPLDIYSILPNDAPTNAIIGSVDFRLFPPLNWSAEMNRIKDLANPVAKSAIVKTTSGSGVSYCAWGVTEYEAIQNSIDSLGAFRGVLEASTRFLTRSYSIGSVVKKSSVNFPKCLFVQCDDSEVFEISLNSKPNPTKQFGVFDKQLFGKRFGWIVNRLDKELKPRSIDQLLIETFDLYGQVFTADDEEHELFMLWRLAEKITMTGGQSGVSGNVISRLLKLSRLDCHPYRDAIRLMFTDIQTYRNAYVHADGKSGGDQVLVQELRAVCELSILRIFRLKKSLRASTDLRKWLSSTRLNCGTCTLESKENLGFSELIEDDTAFP